MLEKSLMIWVHMVIICMVTFIFKFAASAGRDTAVAAFEAAAENTPVDGNKDGSYVTMWSLQGLMYGLVTIASSAGGVLADQTYWQVCVGERMFACVRLYI